MIDWFTKATISAFTQNDARAALMESIRNRGETRNETLPINSPGPKVRENTDSDTDRWDSLLAMLADRVKKTQYSDDENDSSDDDDEWSG